MLFVLQGAKPFGDGRKGEIRTDCCKGTYPDDENQDRGEKGAAPNPGQPDKRSNQYSKTG